MPSQESAGNGSASWRVLEQNEIQAEKARRAFANDVLLGLFGRPRKLPSRYFYDEEGNRLFQQIMDLPEYYLTDCELSILHHHKKRISGHLAGERFNLIELGAGDGTKTRVLLEHFIQRDLDFRYVPIDICQEAVADLVRHCGSVLPEMSTEGLVSEYFDGLHWISGLEEGRNVVLFLGSNIGNFTASEARVFLHSLWNALNDGDFLLIGFDLKKDIDLLVKAYSDSQGVTAEFNLNLLRRINRELGGDFQPRRFAHYASYNFVAGAMESFLVSRESQTVFIEALRQRFAFDPWEPIHTEVSRKFLRSDVAALAHETGFETVDEMTDPRGWFVDSLWRVRKI